MARYQENINQITRLSRRASAPKGSSVEKGNQEFLSMALAYLEIGKLASMADTELKNTHDFENAVAYQMYHSIELFYKYMLSKKGVTKNTHDIAALEGEFRNLFPGQEFQISQPFDFSNYEACELNPDEASMAEVYMKKFKPKFMDQHLKYPRNQNTGGYSFKFESSYFDCIEEQMLRVSEIQC